MSINSINNYSTGNMLDFLSNPQESGELETLNQATQLSSSYSSAKKAYGASMQSSEGQAAIRRALQEIDPQGKGGITFKMITEHRAELEEDFTTMVKAGLLLAGADPNVEFKLVASSDGKMEVVCDDAEQKQIIEKFFTENEELEDEFLYIQALANMEKSQKSPGAAAHHSYLQGVKEGLQLQAMETFFSDMLSSGVGYSSIMAEFGLENTEYFVGANYYV